MAIIKISTIWLLDKDIALRKDEIRQHCLILLIPAVQNLIICDKHQKSLGVPLNIFYLTYMSSPFFRFFFLFSNITCIFLCVHSISILHLSDTLLNFCKP